MKTNENINRTTSSITAAWPTGSDVLADKRRERDTVLFRVMEPYPLRINRNRLDTLYSLTQPDTTAELTYFFHPDHLGSASWITDLSGQPVQHLQYKPFGGDYIDQQDPNAEYSERFRFTGKERDAETGYDYFGARYYSSSLGMWLSVDPMSDKYPSLSPYVYCADNPMRLVDLKGKEIDLSDIMQYDKNTKSDYTKRIVSSLSKITGLDLYVDNNGLLHYTDYNGEEAGSFSARADLIAAIEKKNNDGSSYTIKVGLVLESFGGQDKNKRRGEMGISVFYDKESDDKAHGIGMSFMHELLHAAFGYQDPEDQSTDASYIDMGDLGILPRERANLGEVVERTNKYSKELGLPQREAYPGLPKKDGKVPFILNGNRTWEKLY